MWKTKYFANYYYNIVLVRTHVKITLHFRGEYMMESMGEGQSLRQGHSIYDLSGVKIKRIPTLPGLILF